MNNKFFIFLLLAFVLIIPGSATIYPGGSGGPYNYSSISQVILVNDSMMLIAPQGQIIDFDSLLAAGDIINSVQFDFTSSTPGTWDYTITLYDGVTQFRGTINISEPSAPLGMGFFAANSYYISLGGDTITQSGFGTPNYGLYSIEYYGDNVMLNGQIADGIFATQNVYVGITFCSQMGISSTCGGDLILKSYVGTISGNPMTHLYISPNTTYGPVTGTIAVNIKLSNPTDITAAGAAIGAAIGAYACDFWNPFTWPGCLLNWLIKIIPGITIIITIIAALFGVAAFFFGNFMILVFLVPGIDFAYRLATEDNIFLAISKTSTDCIYLVEMILSFIWYIIKIFIPL